MPSRLGLSKPSLAVGAAAVAVLVILIGVLAWYWPAVTASGEPIAEVPAPGPLFSLAQFTVPAHGRACMESVTVTPSSQLIAFTVFPVGKGKDGGPPLELSLDAPGYHTHTTLSGGYSGGAAQLPITPPPRPLIATVCFHNRGSRPAALTGSAEARTIARTPLTINGAPRAGDVSITLYQREPRDALQLLGQLAAHASNLTDGLIPPALVWILGLLCVLGVPTATVLALHASLSSEDPQVPEPVARR